MLNCLESLKCTIGFELNSINPRAIPGIPEADQSSVSGPRGGASSVSGPRGGATASRPASRPVANQPRSKLFGKLIYHCELNLFDD